MKFFLVFCIVLVYLCTLLIYKLDLGLVPTFPGNNGKKGPGNWTKKVLQNVVYDNGAIEYKGGSH